MIKDNDVIQNIYEHIRKAICEAHIKMIEVNTIVLDENFAISNELYVPMTENSYAVCPPMLFGLKVKYAEKLPLNANFALINSSERSDYERLVKENEKLKKAIKSLKDNIYFTFDDECTHICLQRDVDDECDYTIIFPNKEQYELLKEVLGND